LTLHREKLHLNTCELFRYWNFLGNCFIAHKYLRYLSFLENFDFQNCLQTADEPDLTSKWNTFDSGVCSWRITQTNEWIDAVGKHELI